jgi:hypothetical protein
MSKQSKTAKASIVRETPRQKYIWTTEKAIQEIRNSRAARLFIGNMELVDLLLAAYDQNETERILAQERAADLAVRLDAVSAELIQEKRELRKVRELLSEASKTLENQTVGIPNSVDFERTK